MTALLKDSGHGARNSRRAFTLVELLAVITIIGILIGLLLPAVQVAREAARRTSCGNNLKQLGQACHNYLNAKQSFPARYTVSANYSWIVLVLPYLEAQDTYDKLDYVLIPTMASDCKLWWTSSPQGSQGTRYTARGGDNNGSASNYTAVRNFRSATLTCPSSPVSAILTGNISAVGHLDPSYAGVAGASDAVFKTGSFTDRCGGAAGTSNGACTNGFFYGPKFSPREYTDVGRRPHHIVDGLSKVIAIGEQSAWGLAVNASNGGQLERCRCMSGGRGGWAQGGADDAGNRTSNSTIVARPLGTLECGLALTGAGRTVPWVSDLDVTTAYRSSHGQGGAVRVGRRGRVVARGGHRLRSLPAAGHHRYVAREGILAMIFQTVHALIPDRHRGSFRARGRTRAAILAVIVASSLAAPGCRKSDMAPVSGRVTFDGRPVPKAIVRFLLVSRPMAAAGTDDDGRYRLTTRRPLDGAYIGRHKVVVSPWMPGAGDDPGATAEPERADIPKVVRNADSTPLSVEVTAAGPNVFDFELSKHPR